MKKSISISCALLLLIAAPFTACKKGLDYKPKYGLNTETVYNDPENYIHVLAKLYGSFVLTGNKGPSGEADITGFDEGASGYVRVLWNLQELTTDEAVCGWADPGIPELNNMTWSSDNIWVKYMYYRIYFTIPLCNEFIRESADDKLDEHGFGDADKSKIRAYRAEARFIRALAYYHAIDFFGTGPFVTEDDLAGSFFPEQASRAELFAYVESELLALSSDNDMAGARQNEYGRADKAAVWTLLAKLYLNAEVYTGQNRYAAVIPLCEKIIGSGFSLETQYKNLFLADNHKSQEIIFPITSDGKNTQTYGCTTFLVHAAIGGSMTASAFGVNSGWAGLRSTKNLVNLFTDTLPSDTAAGHLDSRYLFYKKGQKKEITLIPTFTHGYAVAKYRNMTSTGVKGSDASGNFVDTDFPMFRLADVYLMYAEVAARGAGGDAGLATNYLNALRERAYGNSSGNITTADLTTDFILNERAKELHWEATRRTDLIRFGKFTDGGYVWPFKGGVVAGAGVAGFYNLFPIPNSDIVANPNLTQNPGY